jgi:phage baseplate assembly protein W
VLSPKLINGDFVIENGELVMVSGAQELAQSCELVLGTNKGEWFLNPGLGIEFPKIQGKHVSAEAVQEQIRGGLRQETRIKTVDSISVQLDTTNRQMTASFTATAIDDTTVTGGVTSNGIG